MADDPKFLQKVPDDKRFGLSNGRSIGSLEELYTSIRDSDESVFYHHVTSDRNDFANWIKYVIGSEDIFNKVSTIKQKEIFLGVLSDEITFLKNAVQAQSSMTQPQASQQSQQVVPSQPSQQIPKQTSQHLSQQPSQPVSQTLHTVTSQTSSDPIVAPQPSVSSSQSQTPAAQPGSAIIVPSEDLMEFETVLKSVIDEIEAEMFTWEG